MNTYQSLPMTPIDSSEVSNTAAVGKIPQFYDLGGTGRPAINTNRTIFYDGMAAATDVYSFSVRRDVSYQGGSAGFLNSALLVTSNVQSSINPFESGLFVIQDNHSTGGQNFAMGSQANKYSTGPVWGLVTETHEKSASADPATGTLGYELDIFANGTDAHLQRIGIAIMGKLENPAGPGMTLGIGMALTGDSSGQANSRFSRGISFGRIGNTTAFDYCIDTTNAVFDTGGAAILLQHDHSIAFNGNNTRTLQYIQSATRLRYEAPNSHVFDFNDDGTLSITGAYQIFGQQVITSRQSGWGESLNPNSVSRDGFDPNTVSLLKVAQTLAALIADLKTHGLIGS
ncbi:hypothetical protein [Dyella tabacisoli]|uniref:Uncharacterized protein n=1 Tax=Dyella tabacisoli TaxID=2282381 RepID=A0A369UJZ2_9GAMM|nr:hypothetical protein [Dyella tabacisoli]RDD81092.1 hypothetical protein DVJ77_12200 [Dyella tabacisoli]